MSSITARIARAEAIIGRVPARLIVVRAYAEATTSDDAVDELLEANGLPPRQSDDMLLMLRRITAPPGQETAPCPLTLVSVSGRN
ncbi:hypothetical protein [Aureimonas jatrophae]|uniref:Uncharacterized protein n=1 Tax=Aureimonas jatrophae TaxID=1166073 RepID=A0A1H0FS08_9HYPH|nr:hypothetical protein [Aureimonas jatrophae]MBB3950477.1 hypothetical protein [Aureimonas jatrophae]SDN97427.1 hypothetical protein SAMN05192530_102647 [Aureimonas jatrophae]